jgi:hypothetical protein
VFNGAVSEAEGELDGGAFLEVEELVEAPAAVIVGPAGRRRMSTGIEIDGGFSRLHLKAQVELSEVMQRDDRGDRHRHALFGDVCSQRANRRRNGVLRSSISAATAATSRQWNTARWCPPTAGSAFPQ